MGEYAKSKDLHATLRKVWDRSLKPIGFKRCRTSAASYYRPSEDNRTFVRFWAQASQWGDSWSGNSFTLNVDVGLSDPHSVLGGSNRFLGDLSASDLAIAEDLAKQVITRKPKPPLDHWIYGAMSDSDSNGQLWKESFDTAFNYTPGNMKSGYDIWLPYFSVDDIVLWAEFLARPLPSLLAKVERGDAGAFRTISDSAF